MYGERDCSLATVLERVTEVSKLFSKIKALWVSESEEQPCETLLIPPLICTLENITEKSVTPKGI